MYLVDRLWFSCSILFLRHVVSMLKTGVILSSRTSTFYTNSKRTPRGMTGQFPIILGVGKDLSLRHSHLIELAIRVPKIFKTKFFDVYYLLVI